MAGHSKWAKIKRDKGANDFKRAALFTRIGNQIAVAARIETNPDLNPSLAAAIEKAKAANMPLSNIERAIKRVADKSAAILEEVLYEGYGPSGVAILVQCATGNRNRTYPEVKHAFSKNGGAIGEAGCVAFQFERKGTIFVKVDSTNLQNKEAAILQILESGAEDIQEDPEDKHILVAITEPKELHQVKAKINQADLTTESSQISYLPKTTVLVDQPEQQAKLEKIIEALEDLQDVVEVSHNAA